jgi:hypothetical protein
MRFFPFLFTEILTFLTYRGKFTLNEGRSMADSAQIDAACRGFLLLDDAQQDYILGAAQALFFAASRGPAAAPRHSGSGQGGPAGASPGLPGPAEHPEL